MELEKNLSGTFAREKLSENLIKRISSYSIPPQLKIFSFSGDERSDAYIKQKILFGEHIGAQVSHDILPREIKEEEIISRIHSSNNDSNIHGIIVQLPLPTHISPKVVEEINPSKDVDGLHPENLGRLARREKGLVPATARGVRELLHFYKISVPGKNVVILGRSSLVGIPLALVLINEDATVTVAHSKTVNLKDITRRADILCVAIGKPNFIDGEYLQEGQVVIDIGINVKEDGSGKTLVGDVFFEEASKIVSCITPVPGGVGPMTVYALFANLCDAFESTS